MFIDEAYNQSSLDDLMVDRSQRKGLTLDTSSSV